MIEIINKQNKYWVNQRKLKKLMKRLAQHYRVKNPELSLSLVNNPTIKHLHQRFLDKNSSTDVLSFPIREKGPDGKFYLGDIVVSVHQAFQKCFLKKHGLERELEHLIIHGFLHLLGYEHLKGIEEEEKEIKHLLLEGEDGN